MSRRLMRYVNRAFVILAMLCAIGVCGAVTSQAVENPTVTLNVSYDENIRCGEEWTFTLDIPDGSGGQYKYYFGSVLYKVNGVWESVNDPTKASYSTNNTYKFTFYASGEYELRFDCMDLGTSPVGVGKNYLKVVVEDDNYPNITDKINTVKQQCLDAGCQTDYEKALWMHDWLLDNCTFDNTYTYCSAEAAICRGIAICDGYQEAYAMLLNSVGVEAVSVRVVEDNHAWNAVKLDGKWYQVDVTWDDNGYSKTGSDETRYYFAITDDIMALIHTHHSVDADRPCTSLEDNYFVKSGKAKKWGDAFEQEIQEKLDAGTLEFSMDVASSQPANYKNVIYNITAYDLMGREWTANDKEYSLEVTYGSDEISVIATEKASEPAPEPEPDPEPDPEPTPDPTPDPEPDPEPCEHNFSTIWTTDADYHWHVCKNAGCDEVSGKAEHDWGEWTVTKAATCTESGSRTRACQTCKKTETGEIAPLGHKLVHHEGKAATCTEAGWNAYDTCSECDYTTYEEIAPLGHKTTVRNAKAATCTAAGYTGDTVCTDCGTVLSKGSVIAAHGHKIIKTKRINSTCCSYGYKSHYECKYCHQCYKDKKGKKKVKLTKYRIKKKKHSYTKKIVAPKYLKKAATKKSPAIYKKACKWCGKAGSKTYKYGRKLK